MKLLLRNRVFIAVFILLSASQSAKGQFLMDMVDTTKEMGKGMLSIFKKYDRVKISGYMQPQFQAVQSKGAKSYSGGDFAPNVDNRFMIRRGRLRIDYVHFSENKKPSVQVVFQFDGSERGFFIRDFWGRIMENNTKLFSFTAGMFARPFGYELNLGSSDRESPERGRMSQILMKTERDLGAMVSFEPRNRTNWLKYIKLDAGIFNGPGLTALADYDSYKDFISRASLRSYPLQKNLLLSAGVSYFNGGLMQNDKYYYTLPTTTGQKQFIIDSSQANIGRKLPRKYNGVDAQIKWIHNIKGAATELRGEYWWGKQTSSAITSETPPAVFTTDAYYTRQFNGAFFYLLHSFDSHNQIGVKYDLYDPNIKLSGNEISTASGSHAADIKYSTLGVGYIHYFDENLKLVTWYEFVRNESTALDGYAQDLEDNILTLRLQFKF
ncbi:MAG: porin [Panacibacter sp.]